MSRPTISIISTIHGPGLGAERVLEDLVYVWPNDSLTLSFIAPPGSSIQELARETKRPFMALPTSRDSLVEEWKALKTLAKSSPPHLIHAWSARAFPLAALLAKNWSIPSSGTLHDNPQANYMGRARQLLTRYSANQFYRLATVSRAVKVKCRETGYRVSMDVLYNGLEDRPLPSVHGDRPITIGFMGMYSPLKGFPLVADWIQRCSFSPLRWNLYGTVHPQYQNLGNELHRLPNLTLRGHQPSSVIFNEIDILVFCSQEFDSLPTVLIEAARAACPVVAADIGGVAEIVQHQKNGLLFNPTDATAGFNHLIALAEDPGKRKAMGTAARVVYSTFFQADRAAQQYEHFWNSLL